MDSWAQTLHQKPDTTACTRNQNKISAGDFLVAFFRSLKISLWATETALRSNHIETGTAGVSLAFLPPPARRGWAHGTQWSSRASCGWRAACSRTRASGTLGSQTRRTTPSCAPSLQRQRTRRRATWWRWTAAALRTSSSARSSSIRRSRGNSECHLYLNGVAWSNFRKFDISWWNIIRPFVSQLTLHVCRIYQIRLTSKPRMVFGIIYCNLGVASWQPNQAKHDFFAWFCSRFVDPHYTPMEEKNQMSGFQIISYVHSLFNKGCGNRLLLSTGQSHWKLSNQPNGAQSVDTKKCSELWQTCEPHSTALQFQTHDANMEFLVRCLSCPG